MPDAAAVVTDPVLYAHASRLLHLEANPGNARALVQRHGDRDVWINPPPLPLAKVASTGFSFASRYCARSDGRELLI
jgi:hypothetical protein